MKTFIGYSMAAAAAFVFMGLQTGLFFERTVDNEEAESQPIAAPKRATRARFPEDLAPAARAKPVEAAAEYKPAEDRPHKLVCLKVNGALHPWQEDAVGYSEDWAAGNVEETELALIIGSPVKKLVQRVTFANGPPVDRNQWEVEISVVEAKTGKVLGNRTFVNLPRAIRNQEVWELTALGKPVQYLTVFKWLSNQARAGFPNRHDTSPIMTVIERN